MTEVYSNNTITQSPIGVIVSRSDVDPISIDTTYATQLLEAATNAAIEGAFRNGADVPVGAAAGRNGEILAANYAQDNLLQDNRAHAEFMTIQKAHESHPGKNPDMMAVTLEPCTSCQNFLAELPDLKVVIFTLPLSAASLRRIIRTKRETIFDRSNRGELPFYTLQLSDDRLTSIGNLLLDVTERDIETGATRINTAALEAGL